MTNEQWVEYYKKHPETLLDFLNYINLYIDELTTELKELRGVDWDDAPHWANYRAVDSGGTIVWFENKPVKEEMLLAGKERWCNTGGRYEVVDRKFEPKLEEREQ